SKPSCGARKKAVKAVLVTGASAFVGALFRYLLCMHFLTLPLYIAAALTILAVILLMKRTAMFIPPAGAVSILAMLIPESKVVWFPVQITLGAAIAMGAALVFFRNDKDI
ncbi:MAG: HPP family protein, partial [Lachnospiraceae bacterium]|nr:HPP family protein [Lachnospiraceae bacterium]